MPGQQLLQNGQPGFAPVSLPRSPSCAPSSIPLFNCAVAGFRYYDGFHSLPTIHPGDLLTLVREPDNPHDDRAIAVHATHDGKLGYIPRHINDIPAWHLDHGNRLHAVINHIDFAAPPWEMLEITVVMICTGCFGKQPG